MEDKKLINFLNIKGVEYEVADKHVRDILDTTISDIQQTVSDLETSTRAEIANRINNNNTIYNSQFNSINTQLNNHGNDISDLSSNVTNNINDITSLRNEIYNITDEELDFISGKIDNQTADNFTITDQTSRIDVLWRKIFPPEPKKITIPFYGYYLVTTDNNITTDNIDTKLSSFTPIFANNQLKVNDGVSSASKYEDISINERYLYILVEQVSTISVINQPSRWNDNLMIDDEGHSTFNSSNKTLIINGNSVNCTLYKYDTEDDAPEYEGVRITVRKNL